MVVRLLGARVCAIFFPRVLTRFMDLTVLLVRAIELRLITAAVVVTVVTAVALVVASIIPAAGLLVAVARPTVISTMATPVAIIAIALARGTADTASVPFIVASMVAMASVLSEGLLIASVARAAAIALGLPGFRETV